MQGTGSDPLKEHMKVAPGWSDSNVKVALRLPLGSGGPVRMNVSGSPSTVQVRLTGVGSTRPKMSKARTRSVCCAGRQLEELVDGVAGLERLAVQRALELLDVDLVAGEGEDPVRTRERLRARRR